MKLYAQIGHGNGDKTSLALNEGLVDGAILSPRDWRPEGIDSKIRPLIEAKADADILIDPQFYATFAATSESARTGKLTEWPYFSPARKSDLEVTEETDRILRETMQFVLQLPVTACIAPNIYISRSFDSREAVIAKNFIRNSRKIHRELKDSRPLYATIAVSREALLKFSEFDEFLNDITMLKDPPDGFYILVGSRGTEARTDILHADVIARWMLLTHSLSINGFETINGFSDLITPFLGVAGADAGAFGWWSNLRTFSLDRFMPASGGGRQPIKRYLSKRLLNRITFTEYDALRTLVPSVANGLSHDDDYSPDDPEPDRTAEALQAWEAMKGICSDLVLPDIDEGLVACENAIMHAEATYTRVADLGLSLDQKSNADHLEPLKEGIGEFKKLAGLA